MRPLTPAAACRAPARSNVVAHVRNQYPHSLLFAAGWSLGANIMTRYLGGWLSVDGWLSPQADRNTRARLLLAGPPDAAARAAARRPLPGCQLSWLSGAAWLLGVQGRSRTARPSAPPWLCATPSTWCACAASRHRCWLPRPAAWPPARSTLPFAARPCSHSAPQSLPVPQSRLPLHPVPRHAHPPTHTTLLPRPPALPCRSRSRCPTPTSSRASTEYTTGTWPAA